MVNISNEKPSGKASSRTLFDHGRILTLLGDCHNLADFLHETVRFISEHLNTNVCSIYFYEENSDSLLLRANIGLRPAAVNSLRLQSGQGIVGTAFETGQIIRSTYASLHPQYSLIPDIDEEKFESFLAVPVQRGSEKIGVLVTQRTEDAPFTDDEVASLRVLTEHLVGAIENARALYEIRAGAHAEEKELAALSLSGGRGVSAGVAFGRANVIGRESAIQAINQQAELPGKGTADDLARAFDRTRQELREIQDRLEDRLPEAVSLVMDAQLLMLMDSSFTDAVKAAMDSGFSASRAVAASIRHYMDLFAGSRHDYMREKAQDVADLGLRILRCLEMEDAVQTSDMKGNIIVAGELLPSDVLLIAAENAAGLVFVSSGVTAHVALLVRSLRIPLVLLDDERLLSIPDDTPVLIDADEGRVYTHPAEDLLESYREPLTRGGGDPAELASKMASKTQTLDGVRVQLMANINLLADADLALAMKAEGVGLYRTEVPFLLSSALPSRDEQMQIYRGLFQRMRGQDVIIRTLDVGGDKILGQYDEADEMNPALGLRSTRFTLHHPEIFNQQLEAMLLAAEGLCPLKIMFPMISSPDEFILAREHVAACVERLSNEANVVMPQVGMMLEVPAAIEMIEAFIGLSDFFSIGTNDLVQYLLAVDRANTKVAPYYCEHHPAVLRTLARLAGSLSRADAEFSLCGEMAHESRYIPFLLGIGVLRLSLDASFLSTAQRVISSLTMADAKAYADALLGETSVEGVSRAIGANMEKLGLLNLG